MISSIEYDAAAADSRWSPDLLRRSEFARLDRKRCVYLDYTGAALHPASLVRRHHSMLNRTVLGNPHSAHASSRASARWIQRARDRVLRFFDASPADYDVVFTANASAAIRLVTEFFPYTSGRDLLLTTDNHNSVHGMRVRAARCGAEVRYIGLDGQLRAELPELKSRPGSLLAYPAQSNFTGVHHPLEWVHTAHAAGHRVLLDAAAYVPTHPLSLRRHPADFVAVSFYKMFGYPTGIGALIVRQDALRLLRRDDFTGGTVEFVSVAHGMHKLRPGAEGLEDGTANFAAMPVVVHGLDWLDRLGMPSVAAHVHALTSRLLRGLRALEGSIEIYGPGTGARGGIVAFNVRRMDGSLIPFEQVETLLSRRRIYVRGGCFCNPGASERAFGLEGADVAHCLRRKYDDPFTPADLRSCVPGRAVGALRASVGIPTTTADVDALVSALVEIAGSPVPN